MDSLDPLEEHRRKKVLFWVDKIRCGPVAADTVANLSTREPKYYIEAVVEYNESQGSRTSDAIDFRIADIGSLPAIFCDRPKYIAAEPEFNKKALAWRLERYEKSIDAANKQREEQHGRTLSAKREERAHGKLIALGCIPCYDIELVYDAVSFPDRHRRKFAMFCHSGDRSLALERQLADWQAFNTWQKIRRRHRSLAQCKETMAKYLGGGDRDSVRFTLKEDVTEQDMTSTWLEYLYYVYLLWDAEKEKKWEEELLVRGIEVLDAVTKRRGSIDQFTGSQRERWQAKAWRRGAMRYENLTMLDARLVWVNRQLQGLEEIAERAKRDETDNSMDIDSDAEGSKKLEDDDKMAAEHDEVETQEYVEHKGMEAQAAESDDEYDGSESSDVSSEYDDGDDDGVDFDERDVHVSDVECVYDDSEYEHNEDMDMDDADGLSDEDWYESVVEENSDGQVDDEEEEGATAVVHSNELGSRSGAPTMRHGPESGLNAPHPDAMDGVTEPDGACSTSVLGNASKSRLVEMHPDAMEGVSEQGSTCSTPGPANVLKRSMDDLHLDDIGEHSALEAVDEREPKRRCNFSEEFLKRFGLEIARFDKRATGSE